MQWIDRLAHKTCRASPQCGAIMKQILFYKEIPSVLVLEYPFKNIVTSHIVQFKTDIGIKTLKLQGIIYHGQYHV